MNGEAWRLQCMGLQRVGHDLATKQQQQSAFTVIPRLVFV